MRTNSSRWRGSTAWSCGSGAPRISGLPMMLRLAYENTDWIVHLLPSGILSRIAWTSDLQNQPEYLSSYAF